MVEESTKTYPKSFYKLFRKISSKRRSKSKGNPSVKAPTNKTCKKFCTKVFLPIREEVEMEYVKRNKLKNIEPSEFVKKFVKKAYLQVCNDIYCQPKCKTTKNTWLKSFTKARKEKLIQQGAISGCRDLMKEFPEYYKNI